MSAQAQQSLHLLSLPLQDLRAELSRLAAANPAMEDLGDRAESLDSDVEPSPDEGTDERTLDESPGEDEDEHELDLAELIENAGAGMDDYDVSDIDNFTGVDEEARERRDHFFDSQVAGESLAAHLAAQIPVSGLNEDDSALALALIGHIDDDGYFGEVDSNGERMLPFADMEMVTGRSEADMRRVLGVIRTFDPEGCGAVNLQECLLSQLDKVKGSHLERETAGVIERLGDIAAGRAADVMRDLSLSPEDLKEVLELVKSLNPAPGRAFSPKTASYVRPEVYVSEGPDGKATVRVDSRDVPEVRVRRSYLDFLQRPLPDESSPNYAKLREARDYVKAKVAEVEAIRDALANRDVTILRIAREIVAVQEDWLLKRSDHLNPLTMREVAGKVSLHEATVSRTVNGKWMSTPRGPVEMRSLFAGAIKGVDGALVSQKTVLDRLKAIIDSEPEDKPHSDQKLAEKLEAEGFSVARRTVAKYRDLLGIPGASARKRASEKL